MQIQRDKAQDNLRKVTKELMSVKDMCVNVEKNKNRVVYLLKSEIDSLTGRNLCLDIEHMKDIAKPMSFENGTKEFQIGNINVKKKSIFTPNGNPPCSIIETLNGSSISSKGITMQRRSSQIINNYSNLMMGHPNSSSRLSIHNDKIQRELSTNKESGDLSYKLIKAKFCDSITPGSFISNIAFKDPYSSPN